MQFKTQREQQEFGQLADKNMPLKRLLVSLDNFCAAELGKEIELTSIYRTLEENQAVNAKTKVHCYWLAADISIHTFSDSEITRILSFLDLWTYRGTPGHKVGLVHAVPGGAKHLHLQYS